MARTMDEHPTIGVEEEFLLVDTDTGEPVAPTSDELRAELTRLRRVAADAASACGVRLPCPVAVPNREAAVQVSNWLRPWLPLLLALTANSAIYRNAETGYASWRSILWARWPSAGPPSVGGIG